MTRVSLAPAFHEVLGFLDRMLALPEVRDSPNVEYIRQLQGDLLVMPQDEPLSPADVGALLTAWRYRLTGIPATALGYPPQPEQDAAIDTTLRTAGQFLRPYAAQHSAQIQRIVDDLAEGHAPLDAGDTAALLALILHGLNIPPRPRRKRVPAGPSRA